MKKNTQASYPFGCFLYLLIVFFLAVGFGGLVLQRLMSLPESINTVFFSFLCASSVLIILYEQWAFNRRFRRTTTMEVTQLPPPFRWFRAPYFWMQMLSVVSVGLVLWALRKWRFGCNWVAWGIPPRVIWMVQSVILLLAFLWPILIVDRYVFFRSRSPVSRFIGVFFLLVLGALWLKYIWLGKPLC